ncbi:MAG: type IV pilus secretin PilQ [Gammaproteobacteria bacterium]|nr:type IV pilus secretin PilQ [Gammaproteobacteria bacterium]MBU1653800.1 type IV pilus secretin PilQ [Gammaproteobacteria bacterium]MBU1961712.1 type IV pilus secretin PilQ [Gammaproteobacteria bacterium]
MHRPQSQSWIFLGLMGLLALLISHPALSAGISIEKLDFSSLPGDRVQIRVKANGNLPKPSSFTTDNPARLAVDFDNVGSKLPKMSQGIGIGMARSIMALEAGHRTRLILNLVDAAPYDIQVNGNQAIITVSAGSQELVTAKSTPPPLPVTKPAVKTATARQKAIAAVSSKGSGGPRGIRNIDFRRGASGEGRLLISLSDPNTVADMKEQGGAIVVDFIGAQLPPNLMRRLDVTDFATPAQMIEAVPNNGNTRITIKAKGEYEHLAYQTDNDYVVELRPLSKSEVELARGRDVTYTGERLSLNFQDIEVRSVLQLLADFTGLNLVVSDTVGGNITLRLQNVPWDQALDIILKTKGLTKRQKDTVILIAPTEEIAAREKLEMESQKQVEELAPLRTEWVRLNFAKAEVVAALLSSGNSGSTDTLQVTSNVVGGGATKLDQKGLLSARGSVAFDARTNTLMIKDTDSKQEEIRELIKILDIPIRQVLIESRIVIASDDFAKDIGVRLGATGANSLDRDVNGQTNAYVAAGGGLAGNMAHLGGPIFENAAGSGNEALLVNLPQTLSSGTGGAINFVLGKIGSHLLRLELNAMQTEGKGEIISTPRIVTSDQTKATIKQGVEIPYQEASSSGATTVSFKEAVLKLEVTPHITPDDRVVMELNINKDNPDYTRQVLGVPPIDTRQVETSVLVDNGETVVLGGVFERTKSYQKNQVPVLGDLPYLGRLFKNTAENDENSELLIFITPKILKDSLAKR